MTQEHNLKAQTIGWARVAGLGVAIVVAGQFVGWNFGLALGGWGGMFLAMLLVALLYFGLAQSLAELSSALPSAGGFYIYGRLAFGPFLGFLAGLSVLIALTVGAGIATEFITAYSRSVVGIDGWPLKLALFVVIIGIHIRGVGEALSLTFVIGAVAVAILLVFMIAMVPHFQPTNLINLADGTKGALLPFGAGGVFACIPFAVWLFLGLEQAALASEEAADPARTMPKGLLVAIVTLFLTAIGVLLLAAGGGGAEQIKAAGDPLYAAIVSPLAYGRDIWIAKLIGIGALAGLVATFFSLIYSASRQLFALARDCYLPSFLARTGKRGTPYMALIAIGVFGYPISFLQPDQMLVLVVLLLNFSYLAVLASFIRLRIISPELPRPYRALGGVPLAAVSFGLSILVAWSCFQLHNQILLASLAVYGLFILYFVFVVRKHPAYLTVRKS